MNWGTSTDWGVSFPLIRFPHPCHFCREDIVDEMEGVVEVVSVHTGAVEDGVEIARTRGTHHRCAVQPSAEDGGQPSRGAEASD